MKTNVVMTRDVLVVPPEMPLAMAKRIMEGHSIRHLPVVSAGRLVGIISDRDILRDRSDKSDVQRLCAEVMSPTPITCTRSTAIGQVARTMLDRKIDALPVVDDRGHLEGLVTSTDLIGLLADHDDVTMLPFEFRVRVAEPARA